MRPGNSLCPDGAGSGRVADKAKVPVEANSRIRRSLPAFSAAKVSHRLDMTGLRVKIKESEGTKPISDSCQIRSIASQGIWVATHIHKAFGGVLSEKLFGL